ncbi:MAG TPA: trypsin-like peptidase domain-containing protein [Pirellulales bacterium]
MALSSYRHRAIRPWTGIARHINLACLAITAAAMLLLVRDGRAASATDIIREAQRKSVKIYGAGGLRGLEAYQSGFLISADGYVLTIFSHVLDSDTIAVTLDDGRKLEAKLVGADPRREVAVLKVDAADLPHFDLHDAATGTEGTRVLAFSNLFGVATGDEPVSVLHGTIAAVTSLSARRGAYETTYQGSVYVLDAMTNNPGAAGGALTNLRGELLGLLGKQLRNSRNNIWLNYALPADELMGAVEAIKAGKTQTETQHPAIGHPDHALTAADLGLVLVPNVLERTPPFVDAVRVNSSAAKAGICADDLIVVVNSQLVQSCNAVAGELRQVEADAEVRLVLLRSGELKEVTLKVAQ